MVLVLQPQTVQTCLLQLHLVDPGKSRLLSSTFSEGGRTSPGEQKKIFKCIFN